MKLINLFYFISLLNFSNLKTIRDPFQFQKQEQKISLGLKQKVIGYGKSGDGTKFVIVNTGLRTETITQNDPRWALYSN